MTSLGERVRLSVLEGRIDELTHFIVPSNLRRLEQHGVNLREYHDGKEWSKIETEQRNAVRTIQVSAKCADMGTFRRFTLSLFLPSTLPPSPLSSGSQNSHTRVGRREESSTRRRIEDSTDTDTASAGGHYKHNNSFQRNRHGDTG